MKLGFNSNVQLPGKVYHVQTEERGSGHPYIDTVVLCQGQVLHRRSTSCQDLLVGGTLDEARLRSRVEEQHRTMLDVLKAGSLPLEEALAGAPATIEVRLRNAQSWLVAGHASLDVEVCSADGPPVSGADVAATIEGAQGEPRSYLAQTDAEGRVRLQFPMPELDRPEIAALVIKAYATQGQNQVRYRLKPKAGASSS